MFDDMKNYDDCKCVPQKPCNDNKCELPKPCDEKKDRPKHDKDDCKVEHNKPWEDDCKEEKHKPWENDCKEEHYKPWEDDCKTVIEKFLTICLPVCAKPNVKVGKVRTETCGKPIISPQRHCNICEGMNDKKCEFTIIQKMKIEIPIDFDVETKIEDLFLDCELKKDND